MNLDEIQHIAPEIIRIAQKYGISKIFVFGSVARGNATRRSDVDLLVEMDEGASLFGMAGFGYEVEKLLGLQVDVVPISVLPQIKDRQFVENIQKEAVAL